MLLLAARLVGTFLHPESLKTAFEGKDVFLKMWAVYWVVSWVTSLVTIDLRKANRDSERRDCERQTDRLLARDHSGTTALKCEEDGYLCSCIFFSDTFS